MKNTSPQYETLLKTSISRVSIYLRKIQNRNHLWQNQNLRLTRETQPKPMQRLSVRSNVIHLPLVQIALQARPEREGKLHHQLYRKKQIPRVPKYSLSLSFPQAKACVTQSPPPSQQSLLQQPTKQRNSLANLL